MSVRIELRVKKTLSNPLHSVKDCMSNSDEMDCEEESSVDSKSDKKGCWKVLFACLIGNVVLGGLLARKQYFFINDNLFRALTLNIRNNYSDIFVNCLTYVDIH